MNGNQIMLSSAVIVPEADEGAPPTPVSAKRRRSSMSNEESKRPRLSPPPDGNSPPPERAQRQAAATGAATVTTAAQSSEEKKRGKRLFGALLGALNQGSSSAAQRRRGDIERKQREKLKSQAQQDDEQREKEREASLLMRQQGQSIFLKQAARTRHANRQAMAYFLQTKSEPRIYFKPWQLLPDQKVQTDKQIEEASKPERAEEELDASRENLPDSTGVAADLPPANTDSTNEAPGKDHPPKRRLSETSRDGHEDGGDDFVKGDEDDVIY